MADQKKPLPDRLSLNPRSEHFDEDVLSQGVGIRFNGVEKTNVIEYSVSAKAGSAFPPGAASTASGSR